MSEFPVTVRRSVWLRGLLMILMGMAYQFAATILFFVALIQFVLAVASDTPNPRLMAFGRSLGRYLGQIANFVSFATEQPAFPFADWPATDQ
jgi:nucleoside recognition membrane protein YjiH